MLLIKMAQKADCPNANSEHITFIGEAKNERLISIESWWTQARRNEIFMKIAFRIYVCCLAFVLAYAACKHRIVKPNTT